MPQRFSGNVIAAGSWRMNRGVVNDPNSRLAFTNTCGPFCNSQLTLPFKNDRQSPLPSWSWDLPPSVAVGGV